MPAFDGGDSDAVLSWLIDSVRRAQESLQFPAPSGRHSSGKGEPATRPASFRLCRYGDRLALEKFQFGWFSILSITSGNVCTARFVVSNSPNIVRSAVGEIEMIAEPKRKPHQNDNDRDKRECRHQEKSLDEALKNTFPASDPVSVEQPVPPAADRRAKT